jgi:hypothetical protein
MVDRTEPLGGGEGGERGGGGVGGVSAWVRGWDEFCPRPAVSVGEGRG